MDRRVFYNAGNFPFLPNSYFVQQAPNQMNNNHSLSHSPVPLVQQEKQFGAADQRISSASVDTSARSSCSNSPAIANSFESDEFETTPLPSRGKKQYETWTQEEQKMLVSLWAERHDRLESKDARKVWDEIARELNKHFRIVRTVEKCKIKIKYLIEKYKGAKDWNTKQSGGQRRQSIFYEEIDVVLGCRDVVTLRHVAEVQPSASGSGSQGEGTSESHSESNAEARTKRKKNRKRARVYEDNDDDERDMLKASMSTLEEQRKDMNTFMNSFTKMQGQQVNTMNTLVGALTNFLQNSKAND